MSTRPRRVAMAVNNTVDGDSRVQRVALAAADAGWEVLLLGRSGTGRTHRTRVAGLPAVLVAPAATLTTADRGLLRRRDAVAGHSVAPWQHGGWQHGGWRRLDPWVQALELAMAPHLEAFAPDLVHAHDRHTLGLAARSTAALRAGDAGTGDAGTGRRVAWVADVHEDVGATAARGATGWRGALRRAMVTGQQAEWLPAADAVVTVSDTLADRLAAAHHLRSRPTVVLNAPLPATSAPGLSLRRLAGVGPDDTLAVYAGGCAPARGLASVVDALALLDRVHLALVCSPTDADVPALLTRAADRGVATRVHRVDYVPADQVVSLLRGADIGLVPLLHLPNHEISLVTKYLEYLHAGLPVVTSDVKEMAAFTLDNDLGATYPAGDAAALAGAVRSVLGAHAHHAMRVATSEMVSATAWPRQAERLLRLYDSVTAG